MNQTCLWIAVALFVVAGICGFSVKHKEKVIPFIAFAWAAVILSLLVEKVIVVK